MLVTQCMPDDARLPHQQFAAPSGTGRPRATPDRRFLLRCATTCSPASAGVAVRSVASTSVVPRRRPCRAASRPGCAWPARGCCRQGRPLGVALGRVVAFVFAAGRRPANAAPARRAASRWFAACARNWRRRSPCGRCRGSRGRRSARTARSISLAPALRTRPAMARSAPSSSQLSMASESAAGPGRRRQLVFGDRRHHPVAFCVRLRACEALKLSRAQNSGSQRSRSCAARLARWAELMTSTA